MSPIRPIVVLSLFALLVGCSEPTPESRAQAEASFPQPDQNILTHDIPKETPPEVRDAMDKLRAEGAELAADAKERGQELLDKAKQAYQDATAKE